MPTYSIIVDLEATCCDGRSFPRQEMEIIEIGAVAVESRTAKILDEFQSFVRPIRNPVLTDFCQKLTSITHEQVASAPEYPQVIKDFGRWLENYPSQDFCSWGAYDKGQFEQDCRYHKVPYPFPGPHRNLKIEFSKHRRENRRYGLAGALRTLGFSFEGTHHRGIDDARNIARIYQFLNG